MSLHGALINGEPCTPTPDHLDGGRPARAGAWHSCPLWPGCHGSVSTRARRVRSGLAQSVGLKPGESPSARPPQPRQAARSARASGRPSPVCPLEAHQPPARHAACGAAVPPSSSHFVSVRGPGQRLAISHCARRIDWRVGACMPCSLSTRVCVCVCCMAPAGRNDSRDSSNRGNCGYHCRYLRGI